MPSRRHPRAQRYQFDPPTLISCLLLGLLYWRITQLC
jgi:hypothetical protein